MLKGMYLADLTFIEEGNDHIVAHERALPAGRRRQRSSNSTAKRRSSVVVFDFFFVNVVEREI